MKLLTFLLHDYATSVQHRRWVVNQLETLEAEISPTEFAETQALGLALTYEEVIDWLLDGGIGEDEAG